MVRTESGTETRIRNGTTRLDFTTTPTTQFVSQQFSDQYVETYLSPSMNLSRLGESNPRFAAGQYNDPFVYGVAESNFRSFNFTGPKRVTADGETRFRYYANSTDALTEFGRDRLRENDVILKNVSLMVEFTADGVIREERYSFTTEEARQFSRVRYTNIGSTAVSEPAWLSEAKETINESEGDTSTAVRRIESIQATLLVSGQPENVNPDRGAATALSETSATYAYNDDINRSRVSQAVNVTLPGEYEQATLALGYDAGEVPQGDEENVTLMRYNASANNYNVVAGAFVNTSRDSISGPISENGTYIAVHFPTFAEQRSGDGSAASALAPPRARESQ